jgi:FKBP-type peptidyl-prolyl cis-trans isomerase FkpA
MALLAVTACSKDSNSSPMAPATTSAPYSQTDLVIGSGATANAGNSVMVAYNFWLHDSSKADSKGTLIQANPSFGFVVGSTGVIAGWNRGVPGMRVGGQRRLIIPPDLAYGNNSPDPTRIPQNATLVYDIMLLNVQ